MLVFLKAIEGISTANVARPSVFHELFELEVGVGIDGHKGCINSRSGKCGGIHGYVAHIEVAA